HQTCWWPVLWPELQSGGTPATRRSTGWRVYLTTTGTPCGIRRSRWRPLSHAWRRWCVTLEELRRLWAFLLPGLKSGEEVKLVKFCSVCVRGRTNKKPRDQDPGAPGASVG